MGTTFTKMLKHRGPRGSQWQNPLAFWPRSCLGLPKHRTRSCLLPFEIISFLGFIKTLRFCCYCCCYWLLLFLNLLNINFLKAQSLVFCFFFFGLQKTHWHSGFEDLSHTIVSNTDLCFEFEPMFPLSKEYLESTLNLKY